VATPAASSAQSIGNLTQLWQTHATLARLYAGRQRPDQARQEWQAARTVIDSLRDNLRDPGLRASFISSPTIRQAFEFELPS
jgi:plasmid stabilization system protein ParE